MTFAPDFDAITEIIESAPRGRSGDEAEHTLTLTPDDKYPHLSWGDCTCGNWRSSGAARDFVIERGHARHVGD